MTPIAPNDENINPNTMYMYLILYIPFLHYIPSHILFELYDIVKLMSKNIIVKYNHWITNVIKYEYFILLRDYITT